MKNTRALLLLLIAGTVTFSVGFWFYGTMAELQTGDYMIYAAVVLIVVFSIFIALKQLRDQKNGLPADDELSKRVKEKAAAGAFIGSIYLWTMILLFMGDMDVDREIPIGTGIVGMGLLFIGFWIYYNKKGISVTD